ncbi:MAG: winged helix-turn-helix domain-containing protein [Candidatus Bathyarchaeia archaeon]
MDSWTLYSAMVSLLLLGATFLTARWALIGFKQSKQALKEAASYVSVIVGALSPRIESLEETLHQLRDTIVIETTESATFRNTHLMLQSKYHGLANSIEELVAQHKQTIQELDQLRSRLVVPPAASPALPASPPQPRTTLPEDAVLDRLTPTERQTLVLLTEGPLPAPELGRRLNKSREHMARLMKRLYLEGYVDREADRPPFRYKLNDKLRSSLAGPVSVSPPEKT